MKKIVLFFCFFIFGCAVTPFVQGPIITGIIMWKQGEARKYYNEELLTIYHATKNSLKELNHKITKDEKTKEGYYIVAGEKDKFKINIRAAKQKITEVRVRINFMGDKPYADLLYSTIDANTNTIYFNEEGKPVKFKETVKFKEEAKLADLP